MTTEAAPLSWEWCDDVARGAVLAMLGPRYGQTHGQAAEQRLRALGRAGAREGVQAREPGSTLRRAAHYGAMRAVRLELRRQLHAARRTA